MIDSKSKQIVIDFFGLSGFFDSELISQTEHWDLSVQYRSKKLGMEIKYRESYDSNGFMEGINSAEEYKIIENRKLIDSGVFDTVLLISIYRDGIMRISNITSDYETDEHYSPNSTYFRGGRRNKIYANFRKYKEYDLKTIKGNKGNKTK